MEFTKQEYKYLRAEAKQAGVKVVSVETPNSVYNGVTIAYAPAIPGSDCRMVEVAVSYCAPEDKYDAKIGKYTAICRLFHNEVVKLPLAGVLREMGNREFKERLVKLFDVF
jgi:hypothetical protein